MAHTCHLLGVIGHEDIIAHYNREILRRDAVLSFAGGQDRSDDGQARAKLGAGEVVGTICIGSAEKRHGC